MKTYLYLYFALECDVPILEALRHALVNLEPNRWLLKAAEKGDLETVKLTGICGAVDWTECVHRAERTDHPEIIIYALTKLPDRNEPWDIYRSPEPWVWKVDPNITWDGSFGSPEPWVWKVDPNITWDGSFGSPEPWVWKVESKRTIME